MAKLIPPNWDLPERFHHRLGAQAGRQRAMLHDGHLLLVLHKLPKASTLGREPVFYWRGRDGAWRASEGGKNGLAALRAHVEGFTATLASLDQRLDRAERAADYFEVIQEVGPILRTARNLHRVLQEARDGVPDDREIITLRDLAGDAERSGELVLADATHGLNFTVARRSEEQAELAERIARSGHRLNLIAALFLPVSAFGAMFGMNFRHGLETAGSPWLFWGVLGVALVFGLLVRGSLERPGRAPGK